MTLEEKILNGVELDAYEVCQAFYRFPCILEEEDEARRWSRWVSRVIEVGGKQFLAEGDIGLTECQEDNFEPQTLKEVEVYTEMVPVKMWREVK